jgi:hypothetical protein
MVGSRKDNAYQSLFCGAFVFSENPSAHMARLGVQDYSSCLDVPAYTPAARDCIARNPKLMSHAQTLGVILREPAIALRMFRFAADSMQRTDVTYLSKKIILNNSRDETKWAQFDPFTNGRFSILNLWSEIKLKLFPTGVALFVWLFIMIVIFSSFLRSSDAMLSDLSFTGLLVSIACLFHIWIEVFGDGKRDLIKHLFLPNVLFDIAVICAVNIVLLRLMKLRQELKRHA